MPRFRFFLLLPLPILTASALLLTGAIAQQSPKSAQSASSTPAARSGQGPPAAAGTPSAASPAPKADPRATETIKKALKELDPSRLGWVDTQLWQQVNGAGISFEAAGSYRSGPGHRLRLDLKIHLGGSEGESLLVSDGSWIWRSTRIADSQPTVEKWDLKKIEETLKTPGMAPEIGEEFYRTRTFHGLVPLVETLERQMVFTQQESTRWQGHDIFKLAGEWSAEARKSLTPPPQANLAWQPFIPRRCRLYVDQKPPYWPYRVEWLGPTTASGEDRLLMQMEFREPRIFKGSDKPPPDFAVAFQFDPGKASVLDRTEPLTETLQRAGRQGGPGIRPSGDSPRP
jgi:hypothetical protein